MEIQEPYKADTNILLSPSPAISTNNEAPQIIDPVYVNPTQQTDQDQQVHPHHVMQDGAVPVLQGGVGVAVRAGFQARGGGCGGGEGDRSGGDGNEVVGEEVPARPVILSPIVSVRKWR